MLEFAKLHGLGNDFLVAKAPEAGRTSLSARAREMCDRHCGIGADGILFYQPTLADPDAEYSAVIFNADGSRAEMSGNGVRCLAAFLYHDGQHTDKTIRIRTVSGIKVLRMQELEGRTYIFETSMGHPITDPARIPARVEDAAAPILNHALRVGSEVVKVSITSMGNPHCTTFWPEAASAPVERLGPLLENHECFPNRTNVEFVQVLDRHTLSVRFWERGVGRTLASGTGSSAAAASSILNGLVESPVTIVTELGRLTVRWRPDEELFLTGPAEFICKGIYGGL